jgi:hypothetical protein
MEKGIHHPMEKGIPIMGMEKERAIPQIPEIRVDQIPGEMDQGDLLEDHPPEMAHPQPEIHPRVPGGCFRIRMDQRIHGDAVILFGDISSAPKNKKNQPTKGEQK